MRRCQRKENSCRNAEKKLFSAFFEHYYNVKESSASTHICKFPSRYSLAYSSGSSTPSEVNAQSDPGVVFKSFSAFQQSIANICINVNAVSLWIVFCKYCSHRILSPYRSINYLLQKSEAFQSVHCLSKTNNFHCWSFLYPFARFS